jgi:hypothetical protein
VIGLMLIALWPIFVRNLFRNFQTGWPPYEGAKPMRQTKPYRFWAEQAWLAIYVLFVGPTGLALAMGLHH